MDVQNPPTIIIGSGMAAYTLARELRKHNQQTPITLICQDSGNSYSKPTLSNAFAQQKSAQQLIIANAKQMAETLQIEILNHHLVTDIDTKNKTVHVKNLTQNREKTVIYHQLVLATGANPKTLPMIPLDHQRIFAINHLDEYQRFQQSIQQKLENLPKNQKLHLVIIGAGLIGCEFANDLALQHQDNLQITVIDQADYPLAQLLPSNAGTFLQHELSKVGIEFKFNQQIHHIDCQDKIQLYLNSDDDLHKTQPIFADMLLLAIGLSANTALAQQAQLTIANNHTKVNHCDQHNLPKTANDGILVNQFLQTSAEDVYAMGDCVNVMHSHLPYVMPLMCQAKALAKTLADSLIDPNLPKTAVVYPAMPIVIKTPSCPVVILPVPAKFSQQVQWQQQTTADGLIFTAYQENSEQLIGFILIGKEASKQRMNFSKLAMPYLSAPLE